MEIVFIDEDLAILYEGGKVKRKELMKKMSWSYYA